MHEQAATAAHGLWSDAGRRLTGNRIAFAALAVMVVMALFAVLAPHLSPWGYDSLDWEHLALALRRRDFIEAARALGVPAPAILLRHIVPNLLGPVLVYATLTVPQMIVFESFLSFLGLGVQEPHASLGNLILVGAQEMESAPWMLLVPAAFLVGLLICLNFLGDGLRDAFDPRER